MTTDSRVAALERVHDEEARLGFQAKASTKPDPILEALTAPAPPIGVSYDLRSGTLIVTNARTEAVTAEVRQTPDGPTFLKMVVSPDRPSALQDGFASQPLRPPLVIVVKSMDGSYLGEWRVT